MKYQLFHIYMLLLLYFICISGPNEFPEEEKDPYSNNSNDNDMSEESTTEDEQQADTSISIG